MTDEKQPEIIEKDWGRVMVFPDGSQMSIIKHRRAFIADEDYSLDPTSLVGSWFHVFVNGSMVWQGAVVGEPQAGRYLCDIDILESGASNVQRLFSLDTMMGLGEDAKRLLEGSMSDARAPVIDPQIEWRLYDSEGQARSAYSEWVTMRALREEAKDER